MSLTEDHRDRVVSEALGGVDVFTESEGGPNGPWEYRSLQVTRRGNRILVNDVDGRRCASIAVADLPDGDEAHDALKERLEELNEETLDAL